MNRYTFALAALLSLAGCVSGAVKDQVKATAAAHDGYDRLIRQTVGELPVDGVAVTSSEVVTQADLDATPLPVRNLLMRVTRSLYKSGRAWRAADHALNGGPDPDQAPVAPPAILVPAAGQ
jgi:hypothetical protein